MRKLLVIDVGNTSTAMCLWSGSRMARRTHIDGRRPEDRAAAAEKAAAGIVAAAGGTVHVAYASVVPAADAAWRRFAAKIPDSRLVEISCRMFAGGKTPCGLALDYPHPETVGADRLAFTASVIAPGGRWTGGAIAPGLPLMLDYMHERTAKLPKIGGIDRPPPKIGRSTEEAMRLGAIAGYRGMAREIVRALAANFKGKKFRLVATGGFAKRVLAGSGMDFTLDPALTLKGIACLAECELGNAPESASAPGKRKGK